MNHVTVNLIELITFLVGGNYSKLEVTLIDGSNRKPFLKAEKSAHKRPVYLIGFFNGPNQRYRGILTPAIERIKAMLNGLQITNPMFQVHYQ